MQCICDDDISALIIAGDPSPVELGEAWMTLFYEYCDLVDASEVKYRLRLFNEIKLKKRKLLYADAWSKILELYYNPDFVKGLQYIGFDYDLNPHDPAQFAADLKRIAAELRTLRLNIRVKEAEYEYIEKNKSSSGELNINRKYFYTLFDKINDLKKWASITEKSTVMQYAIALSRMVEYAESLKSKVHGR